jgi:membrane associated rhomboid family serine protease
MVTTKVGRRGTFAIALVLVAVFAFELMIGAAGSERALVPLGALRTRGWSAADGWRILTFSFLHLNALHLAMNMAGLIWLGSVVERRLGSARFVAIFAASAVASGIAAMLLGPLLPTTGVAVGASGAIFGLLAAALALVFRGKTTEGGEEDRRLRRPLVIVLVVAVAISLVPGVSFAGHLGGFAGGALIASLLA